MHKSNVKNIPSSGYGAINFAYLFLVNFKTTNNEKILHAYFSSFTIGFNQNFLFYKQFKTTNKLIMKIKLYLFIIAAFAIAACSKKDDASPQTDPPVLSGESSTVYFIDTFRVYSTNLSGGDRKLLIDEDLKSGNNYITSLSVMPSSNKLVYHYTTGYQNATVIKVANADGTNIKTIKTLTVGTQINFLKGITDNKIFYGSSITASGGATTASKFYVMNDDGTNEKELPGFPYLSYVDDAEISNQGKGFLSTSSSTFTPGSPSKISTFFFKLNNGVFVESDSKYVLSDILMDDMASKPILSNDITKIAYALKSATTNKIEIKVKDITTPSATATTVYTLTVPAEIKNPYMELYWVSGTQKLLAYYGNWKGGRYATSDSKMTCELIDVAKGTAINWVFTGDGMGEFIVN